MPTAPKNGPMTREDLTAVWVSIVDPLFSQPFLDAPDKGFEVYEQGMEQLARVSSGIDVTTQALYINPWSGQSAAPAAGEAKAIVALTFERTKLIQQVLVVGPEVLFEEVVEDASEDGPVEVLTGRRYHLLAELVFNPGEAGPLTASAEAVAPGWGYNNPRPGTIRSVVQVGSNLSNDLASVAVDTLLAANRPDVPVPQHVGQWFRFTAGINQGQVKRVSGYGAPNPGGNVGGQFHTDPLAVVRGVLNLDTFAAGATVVFYDDNVVPPEEKGRGKVLKQTDVGGPTYTIVSVRLESGEATVLPGGGYFMRSVLSGAELEIEEVQQLAHLSAATSTEAWRMLDWLYDFGMTVGNEASPTGGRLGMLDALGAERKIRRAPGETDDQYRERAGQIADTVCPNAIVRAVNRVIAPYGLSACFREVGTALLPGLYWDYDAWDYDFGERPEDRFRLWLDYSYFRGFFMVGLPALGWGEFGAAWDYGPNNAWDMSSGYEVFWDGHPYIAERLYQQVWQAVEAARPGGVSWELYLERLGCY